ncbi:MAG: hypothetical protein QF834_07755, partial [Candidatus Thalassarchaeaceae archaeon]|nr:hypothetical protein [Candidatus Thalassarchaeaceae archaeon]
QSYKFWCPHVSGLQGSDCVISVWAEYDAQTRNPARLRFVKQIADMQNLVSVPVASIGPEQIQQSQL